MATSLVPSSTQSAQLVESRPTRNFVSIENTDTNTLYLLLGSGEVTPTHYTVSLSEGDYYEVPRAATCIALSGVWAGNGEGGALITTI